jgi:hypothetical protein
LYGRMRPAHSRVVLGRGKPGSQRATFAGPPGGLNSQNSTDYCTVTATVAVCDNDGEVVVAVTVMV